MKNDILKMGLDALLQFESIARHKSLKKASDELRLSQPAITHSLKKLENGLGVELCVRSRAGFALTEPGKRLYTHVKKIKDELKLYEGFLADKTSFDGLLNIGVIDNFQNLQLERNIDKIVKSFPLMKLSIQVYAATEIQQLVANGELDAGLGIFNRKLEQLTYRKVGEETISHYISERHALWNKKEIHESDLKNHMKTWVDIINRDRAALESEIFIESRLGRSGFYANNLNAGVLILQSGQSIVPLPAEYLKTRNLDFKYRALNKFFKPFVLKQELVFHKGFAQASAAAMDFIDGFSKL